MSMQRGFGFKLENTCYSRIISILLVQNSVLTATKSIRTASTCTFPSLLLEMKSCRTSRLFTASFLVVYSRVLCKSMEEIFNARSEKKISTRWNDRCSHYFFQNPTDPRIIYDRNLSQYKAKRPDLHHFPAWKELQYLQKEPFLLQAKQNESRRKAFFTHMEALKRTAFESFQKHVNKLKLFDFQPNPSMFRALSITDQGMYAQQALREIQSAIKYFHNLDKIEQKQKLLRSP